MKMLSVLFFCLIMISKVQAVTVVGTAEWVRIYGTDSSIAYKTPYQAFSEVPSSLSASVKARLASRLVNQCKAKQGNARSSMTAEFIGGLVPNLGEFIPMLSGVGLRSESWTYNHLSGSEVRVVRYTLSAHVICVIPKAGMHNGWRHNEDDRQAILEEPRPEQPQQGGESRVTGV